MRSKEDIQEYLDTHTVTDADWQTCNKYLTSQLELVPTYAFTYHENKIGVKFQDLRDFAHSEKVIDRTNGQEKIIIDNKGLHFLEISEDEANQLIMFKHFIDFLNKEDDKTEISDN